MNNLLDRTTAEEMIRMACSLASEKGLATRNVRLIERAGKCAALSVRNGRVLPSAEAMESILAHLREVRVPLADEPVHLHGWQDMLINFGDDREVIIKLTDLPYQYCEHREKKIVPLSREKAIEGTKLLHVLYDKWKVRGYSCGVPQDTHPLLKAIEQYLVGFRFHRNGGATLQPVPAAVERDFALIRSLAEDREFSGERDLMLFSPSPMLLDADDLYLCFEKDIHPRSFMVGSMPMMGMTGPIDPVGVYVLALAEVLGGAAILHELFPEARAYVYPHPQAMSLHTGQMAFGTIEHARLEWMKMDVIRALGLPYYDLKDIMTSAQMPGALATGDKALGFYTGIMAGFRAFNLMPLSTDQVWSPVQALVDTENLRNAWKAMSAVHPPDDLDDLLNHIGKVIDEGILFSETDRTLFGMQDHYDMESVFKRHFASETWVSSGTPEELDAVEERAMEMLSGWDYRPDPEKLGKILPVYHGLCKSVNIQPIDLE